MKRLGCIILVLCMLVSLTACGEKKQEKADAGFKPGDTSGDKSDQGSPAAVDGTHRPCEKAAVDKAMKLNVFQYDLDAPAQK